MDANKRLFFRYGLLILGWAGICGLLYFFLWIPYFKEEPSAQKQEVKQKEPPASEESPPPTTEPETKDPFQLSFSKSEIQEAQKIVEKFTQLIYEGERTDREGFIEKLKPFTTESYLKKFQHANGLGEPIKIKEKHISYIEQGASIRAGWMGINSTVVTEQGDMFSTMYYLVKENDTWRITEEANGIIPED